MVDIFGSVMDCLQLSPHDTLLVRGGTSATGLAAVQLAKSCDVTVLASTRISNKREFLLRQGANHMENNTANGKVIVKI
jgi:NADPH:quinone reductase-like Zn-dependent oxidoreductase